MPGPEEWPSRQQWRTKFGLQVRLLTFLRSANRVRSSITSMPDIPLLFQAFLAPAIFVSASTGLLILSINVRLMGMVTRLRQYTHARHDAA